MKIIIKSPAVKQKRRRSLPRKADHTGDKLGSLYVLAAKFQRLNIYRR